MSFAFPFKLKSNKKSFWSLALVIHALMFTRMHVSPSLNLLTWSKYRTNVMVGTSFSWGYIMLGMNIGNPYKLTRLEK